MKKTILISVLALFAFNAHSQEVTDGQQADSLVYKLAPAVDSTLSGKSIFNILSGSGPNGEKVSIHQSQYITDAMKKHIVSNPARTFQGYRVRIFFDNNKTARNESENTVTRFLSMYHGIPAYRSYQNPFFKVTVGDFRTKSEAMELLNRIKGSFPSAFVVKENINYPSADRERTFVVDTVKVPVVMESIEI